MSDTAESPTEPQKEEQQQPTDSSATSEDKKKSKSLYCNCSLVVGNNLVHESYC